jgi:hypothetical protein
MISGGKKWAGYEKWMGEKGKVCAVLVEKHEEKRPLGIPWHKW